MAHDPRRQGSTQEAESRPSSSKLTEAEVAELSKKSLAVIEALGPGIEWLYSYVTDDKVYCVYLAPDEDPGAVCG